MATGQSSSPIPPRVKQDPSETIHERIAETVPGLTAAAHAVGLQDHQRMLKDHADRVRQSFAMGQEVLGQEKVNMSNESDMGDIVITGDITVGKSDQAQNIVDSLRGQDTTAPSTPPTTAPPVPHVNRSGLSKALQTAGLAALGIGAGTAMPIVAYNLTKANQPYVDNDTNVGTYVTPGFDEPVTIERRKDNAES